MKITISGEEGFRRMRQTLHALPDVLKSVNQATVNSVGRSVMSTASRDIAQRYNLPASYVAERFKLNPAKGNSVTAVVSARIRPVRLARFDARQLTVAARRAKGDKSRKIGAGRKQGGISVKVLRGGERKAMPGAFFLPLRAGKADGGNGAGIFIRTGKGTGSIKHLLSYVSPHGAFAYWIKENAPDVQNKISETWSAQARIALGKLKR